MGEKLRSAKKGPAPKVDLLVPINAAAFKPKDAEDCLGRAWDMSSTECPVCAMCDICCILFQETLAASVKAVEDKNVTFLDKTDFENINQTELLAEIISRSGEMPVSELIDKVMAIAETADEVAAVEWLKRFIKDNPIKTVEGILWKK